MIILKNKRKLWFLVYICVNYEQNIHFFSIFLYIICFTLICKQTVEVLIFEYSFNILILKIWFLFIIFLTIEGNVRSSFKTLLSFIS